ncbi:multidrug resistance-associated protein 1-like [Littorina saxatilis]|uniref:multidrug resistance-associated protein 1-like n=1 Tax=Littorina saxatilis TaxID=31220 RepID=UPI0038B4F2D6
MITESGFEEFCGGPFWNSTLLAESSWPQLTDCFINTVLVWTPCLFLWLPLPVYLYGLHKRGDVTPLPVTCLNSAKTFFSAMLTLVAVVTLVQDLSLLTYGHVLPVAVYLAAALRIASYTCAAFLTQHERKHDVITSGVQFTFWIILLLCDVIPFYTYIMKEVYHTDLLKFVMLCVTFGGEAVQVVLFSFSEAPDYIKRSGYNSFEKHPCPEMTASFPNQMLFSWMTRQHSCCTESERKSQK